MLVREKIASLDWNKRWNEPISLLLCSYFGEDYIHAAKAAYGIGFTHILFASRNGTVVCYRLESDTKNVGKRLAELFLQEKDAAHAWRDSLIQATDSLDEALSRPPKSFLVPENLHELDARLDSYLPVFIRVNIVPDFLPPDTAENAAAPLVEARAYAEHAYHAVEALFKKISEDIALKEKRNAGLLHNLLNEELRAYTETGKLPQEEDLLSRQNVAGLYVHEGGNVLLDEKEIGEIEKLIAGKSAFGSDILHGTASTKGHARGAVRIIENPREAGIFNDGDILVTSMTNPDFLPLIKRAGAIVTEAGGVLSHAAIVSRELKKPCILNVKGALSRLKNGDNVEVDADDGTIRILDRME